MAQKQESRALLSSQNLLRIQLSIKLITRVTANCACCLDITFLFTHKFKVILSLKRTKSSAEDGNTFEIFNATEACVSKFCSPRTRFNMGGALTYTFCGTLFGVPNDRQALVESVEVPQYEKLHSYALVALESWKKIAVLDSNSRSYVKLTGFSRFLQVFHARLDSCENAQNIRLILSRDSQARSDNLIFGVIRFLIVSFRQKGSLSGQKEIVRRLRALGREHSRIDVCERMLYDFGNAILLAIGDRLEGNKTTAVMEAWTMLLSFVLHHMNSEKVNFVAVTSRQEYSSSRRNQQEQPQGKLVSESTVAHDGRTPVGCATDIIESGFGSSFELDVNDVYAFSPCDVADCDEDEDKD